MEGSVSKTTNSLPKSHNEFKDNSINEGICHANFAHDCKIKFHATLSYALPLMHLTFSSSTKWKHMTTPPLPTPMRLPFSSTLELPSSAPKEILTPLHFCHSIHLISPKFVLLWTHFRSAFIEIISNITSQPLLTAWTSSRMRCSFLEGMVKMNGCHSSRLHSCL